MADRLRENYGWTPRQREVFDLLVQGKTNGEIAEALGISLAGAKWHISEIASKLGVDSREEAAEYWRAYNGLGRRFARVFRGLAAAQALRWAAAGAGVAGIAAGGVVVSGGGEDPTTQEARATEVAATATPGAAPGCPVEQAICDFALAAEQQLQAADYAGLAGSAAGGSILEQQVAASLPAGTPRLASVACPFGAVDTSCAGWLSLVFTTVKSGEDWRGTTGILLLRFERTAPAPSFDAAVNLEDEELRRVALVGGLAQGPCDLAGIAPDQAGGGCSRATFYAYGSAQPFPPSQVASGGGPDLRVEAPAPPPRNTLMYTATGCWGCEGFHGSLQRVLTDANGNTTVEPVPEPALEPGEVRNEITVSPDGAMFAAVACRSSNCGPLGPSAADSSSRLLLSHDGGYSWREAGAYDGYLNVHAGPGGRIAVQQYVYEGGAWRTHWFVPGAQEREIVPPAAAAEFASPQVLADGSLLWLDQAGARLLRTDGSVFFALPRVLGPGEELGQLRVLPGGRVLANWGNAALHLNGGTRGAVGLYEQDGTELWARDYPPTAPFFWEYRSPSLAIGNVQAEAGPVYGQLPAIFDAEAWVVHPIGDPFGKPPLQGRNRFLALLQGSFARVAGAGDCLNLRTEPSTSAQSLGCFRDGVLLEDRGETREAGGLTWAGVETPAGEAGWASAQYLER
jgi:DNA-binding CsgD family transcriptional regulator